MHPAITINLFKIVTESKRGFRRGTGIALANVPSIIKHLHHNVLEVILLDALQHYGLQPAPALPFFFCFSHLTLLVGLRFIFLKHCRNGHSLAARDIKN